MLERLKTALGQTPWDTELRLIYADCLEENGLLDEAQELRRITAKKPGRRGKVHRSDRRATTDNNAIYRNLLLEQFAPCSHCGFHRGCNAGHRPAQTSWKKARKQRRQSK